MREDKLKNAVLELIEPLMAQQNAEIAELVVSRYQSDITLRFFIYSDDASTVGEYAGISRAIGVVLDECSLLDDGYMLEVSSPGLDRPLTTAADFRYRRGETVKVEFVETKRKAITGEIITSDDLNVDLKENDVTVRIPLPDIRLAKIVF